MSYEEAINKSMQVLCMLADRNGGEISVTTEEMVEWTEKVQSGVACMSIEHKPGGPWVFKCIKDGKSSILRELLMKVLSDELFGSGSKLTITEGEVHKAEVPSADLTEADKEVMRQFKIKP